MCSFRRYFRRDFRNRLFKVLVSLKFAAGPITYLQENVAAGTILLQCPPYSYIGFRWGRWTIWNQRNVWFDQAQFPFDREQKKKEREKKKKGRFPCFPWHWKLAKNFGAEVHANPLSLRWLTSLSSGLLVSRITDDGHALSVIHRFFKSPGRSQLSSHRSFWRFLRTRIFTFFHSLRLHLCSDNIRHPCCVHFLTLRSSTLDSLMSLLFQ